MEVRYAGVVVGRGAIVKDLGEGSAFVGVSEPLPVGTHVTLKIGEAVHEARVDDVVESSEPTAVGMRVSWGGAPRASAPAPRVEPPAVAASPPVPEPVQAAPEPVQAVAAVEVEPAEPVAAAPREAVAAPEDASHAIPAPMSLAGAGDGSQQSGGKKRRKRR